MVFDFEGRHVVPLTNFAKRVGIQDLVGIGALEAIVNKLFVVEATSSEALGVPDSWVVRDEVL